MLELLRIAYDGKGAFKDDYAILEQPSPDDRKEHALFRVTPISMQEFADGTLALVSNSEPHDENDGGFSSHGQPGLVSVFVFSKDGPRRKLLRRLENIGTSGSHGQIGDVKWLSLAEGKPGFAVVGGGTWQGYTIQNLALYDLADPSMQDLAGGISLYSGNDGACSEETEECWEVEGTWRFEKQAGQGFDDLILDFSGYRELRPEGAPATAARVRKEAKGMARYRFNGKAYTLVEGENIVPGV
ncbi:MAG: hypothetical protein K0R43_3685 [Pseudoduganella sp.]|nr:hypothetical protein [Pseudoduganella sp.]